MTVIGWMDGPLEGALYQPRAAAYWNFRLIAEERRNDVANDRLFGLWPVSKTVGDVLVQASDAIGVWPVSDDELSAHVRAIGEDLMRPRSDPPALILRTTDFAVPLQLFTVVTDGNDQM